MTIGGAEVIEGDFYSSHFLFAKSVFLRVAPVASFLDSYSFPSRGVRYPLEAELLICVPGPGGAALGVGGGLHLLYLFPPCQPVKAEILVSTLYAPPFLGWAPPGWR